FSILLSSFAFYAYQILYSANILVEKEDRYIVIEQGETFKSLQDKLYDNHYVEDLVSFSFLSKLMSYDEAIKPGRYALEKNMTNLEAIRLLRAGRQEPVNITFNNVRLISELPEKITANLLISAAAFDTALLKFIETNQHGFNEQNIISMFIPNTYEVYYDISAEGLVERMHREYKKFWNDQRLQKAKAIDLTPLEVSTLASIVQAESIKKEESKIIAGLYMNRLEKNIALQADPTLVFAVGDFTLKRVLNVHKEIDSPYNTYKKTGLPPGPINMPEIHSIDAVLDHKDHNYLYMCAKEDFSGYHNFATNLRDHLNNARRYQRQLTIEQRKARLNQN
ncbi:endolytic transglycosylase MltG, partial [Fulvivirga sp. RKSG066]|uniref:endolytic transglycosylase MltG n=1 Tax=Fulvivirga aurantia TaxID=2529383 RepID=UPI0012BC5733